MCVCTHLWRPEGSFSWGCIDDDHPGLKRMNLSLALDWKSYLGLVAKESQKYILWFCLHNIGLESHITIPIPLLLLLLLYNLSYYSCKGNTLLTDRLPVKWVIKNKDMSFCFLFDNIVLSVLCDLYVYEYVHWTYYLTKTVLGTVLEMEITIEQSRRIQIQKIWTLRNSHPKTYTESYTCYGSVSCDFPGLYLITMVKIKL